jgi:hypothetical protein
MQHLEGNGTPVLYIGRTVLKGVKKRVEKWSNGTWQIAAAIATVAAVCCVSAAGC